MPAKSCRNCADWTPEPEDMPQSDESWCHREMRETPVGWRCDEWAERTHRNFGPPSKKVTP
jgi:hypothetical protein